MLFSRQKFAYTIVVFEQTRARCNPCSNQHYLEKQKRSAQLFIDAEDIFRDLRPEHHALTGAVHRGKGVAGAERPCPHSADHWVAETRADSAVEIARLPAGCSRGLGDLQTDWRAQEK